MAQKTQYGLMTKLGKYEIYLDKGFDLKFGTGWICRVGGDDSYELGTGFHKESKVAAVKLAIKNYEEKLAEA